MKSNYSIFLYSIVLEEDWHATSDEQATHPVDVDEHHWDMGKVILLVLQGYVYNKQSRNRITRRSD